VSINLVVSVNGMLTTPPKRRWVIRLGHKCNDCVEIHVLQLNDTGAVQLQGVTVT
jgi:hypothetical protein